MSEPRELQEFLRWQPDILRPLIGDGVMFEGSRVVLYGRYKSLKSMVCIYLAIAAAKGERWLGHETIGDGLKVLYLQLELPEPMLQKRMQKMLAEATETKQPLYVWSEYSLKLDDPEGYSRLWGQVNKLRPDLLIIDPIYKIMKGNLLDARHVQDLFDNVDRLLGDFPKMGCMLVSHSRKAADSPVQGSDDLLGSVLFSAWADSILKVQRNGWSGIEVSYEILRNAEQEIEPRSFIYKEDTCSFVPVGLQLVRPTVSDGVKSDN